MPAGGGAGTVYYLLADHLGSTSTVVDATTGAVTSQKYWPYGALRSGGITQTDKLYTGQQQESGDAGLGLYNYNARFYSTMTGRFLSVDPVTGGADPQSWNPYSYVRGNPLRFTDPTGKKTDSQLEAEQDAYKHQRDEVRAQDWTQSSSMEHERACSALCEGMIAAAAFERIRQSMMVAASFAPSQYSQPMPSQPKQHGGGGLVGRIVHGAAVVGVGIKDGVERCAGDSTCTSTVGLAVGLGGAIASPLCGPGASACAAGAIAAGASIATANDVRSCRGGDDGACVMIGPDILVGGMGAAGALKVRASVEIPIAVANSRRAYIAGIVTAVDYGTSPAEYAGQMIGKLGYDILRSPAVQIGYGAINWGYSVVREQLERLK